MRRGDILSPFFCRGFSNHNKNSLETKLETRLKTRLKHEQKRTKNKEHLMRYCRMRSLTHFHFSNAISVYKILHKFLLKKQRKNHQYFKYIFHFFLYLLHSFYKNTFFILLHRLPLLATATYSTVRLLSHPLFQRTQLAVKLLPKRLSTAGAS